MTTVIAFKTSLTLARATVFSKLLTATSDTESRGAHYGFLPPVAPAWAMIIKGGARAENTWNQSATELHFNIEILGRNKDLKQAEEKAILILLAMPIVRQENIQLCRMRQGGQPGFELTQERLANSKHDQLFWRWAIGLEMVFNTLLSYAEAPEPDP